MKMCQAMAQEGHEPTLYALQGAPDESERITDICRHYGIRDRFPISRLRGRFIMRAYDVAVSALWRSRAERPDLLYTRN